MGALRPKAALLAGLAALLALVACSAALEASSAEQTLVKTDRIRLLGVDDPKWDSQNPFGSRNDEAVFRAIVDKPTKKTVSLKVHFHDNSDDFDMAETVTANGGAPGTEVASTAAKNTNTEATVSFGNEERKYLFISEHAMFQVSSSAADAKPLYLFQTFAIGQTTDYTYFFMAAREVLDIFSFLSNELIAGRPLPHMPDIKTVADLTAAMRPGCMSLVKNLEDEAAHLMMPARLDIMNEQGQKNAKETSETLLRVGVSLANNFATISEWVSTVINLNVGSSFTPKSPKLAPDAIGKILFPQSVQSILKELRTPPSLPANALQPESSEPKPISDENTKRLKDALGGGVDGFIKLLKAPVAERKTELNNKYGTPTWSWMKNPEVDRLEQIDAQLSDPKLKQQLVNSIFQGLSGDNFVGDALRAVDKFDVKLEADVKQWGSDVGEFFKDLVKSNKPREDVVSAVDKQPKLQLGETSIVESTVAAAEAKKADELEKRANALLGDQAGSTAKPTEEDKLKFNYKFGFNPTVALGDGWLKKLAITNKFDLSNSKWKNVANLNVELSDPFKAEESGMKVHADWTTSSGPWQFGGKCDVVAVAVFSKDAYVKQVAVTAFAAYDDGKTKTGVFVNFVQGFEHKDGQTTALDSTLHINPYLSTSFNKGATQLQLQGNVYIVQNAPGPKGDLSMSLTHKVNDKVTIGATSSYTFDPTTGSVLDNQVNLNYNVNPNTNFGMWAGHRATWSPTGGNTQDYGVGVKLTIRF